MQEIIYEKAWGPLDRHLRLLGSLLEGLHHLVMSLCYLRRLEARQSSREDPLLRPLIRGLFWGRYTLAWTRKH
jgi:hypothetical protein